MERIINNKGATNTGRTFIINNQQLFTLRLYALHDCHITQNVG